LALLRAGLAQQVDASTGGELRHRNAADPTERGATDCRFSQASVKAERPSSPIGQKRATVLMQEGQTEKAAFLTPPRAGRLSRILQVSSTRRDWHGHCLYNRRKLETPDGALFWGHHTRRRIGLTRASGVRSSAEAPGTSPLSAQ